MSSKQQQVKNFACRCLPVPTCSVAAVARLFSPPPSKSPAMSLSLASKQAQWRSAHDRKLEAARREKEERDMVSAPNRGGEGGKGHEQRDMSKGTLTKGH